MPVPEKVTDEQAEAAIHQLISGEEPEQEAPAAEEPDPAPEQEDPAVEPPSTAVEAEQDAEATQDDDVTSLRERLKKADETFQEHQRSAQARQDAMQKRFSDNERILRERYVKKSAVTERALKALEAAKSESGLDPAEADRIIAEMRSTMNPASASYAPPPERTVATEDHEIVLNSFLNEKHMSEQDAQEFGKWMSTEAGSVMSPIEQSVANRDLDAFLRIAHTRFSEGKREAEKTKQRADAVGAVKTVQKVQREAAKAASATTAAPKKQPAGARGVDTKKLTKEDISTLLQQSISQYH